VSKSDPYSASRLHIRSINAIIKNAKHVGAVSVTLPDGMRIDLNPDAKPAAAGDQPLPDEWANAKPF
jgi:hypothetical protein